MQMCVMDISIKMFHHNIVFVHLIITRQTILYNDGLNVDYFKFVHLISSIVRSNVRESDLQYPYKHIAKYSNRGFTSVIMV